MHMVFMSGPPESTINHSLHLCLQTTLQRTFSQSATVERSPPIYLLKFIYLLNLVWQCQHPLVGRKDQLEWSAHRGYWIQLVSKMPWVGFRMSWLAWVLKPRLQSGIRLQPVQLTPLHLNTFSVLSPCFSEEL